MSKPPFPDPPNAPSPTPWVEITTRGHLRAAAAAVIAAARPLVAVTPAGSIDRLGPGWLAALSAGLCLPPALLTLVDCGGRAGWAQAALALGLDIVAPELAPAARPRLAALADQLGRRVLFHRPPALDLGPLADAEAACLRLLLPDGPG